MICTFTPQRVLIMCDRPLNLLCLLWFCLLTFHVGHVGTLKDELTLQVGFTGDSLLSVDEVLKGDTYSIQLMYRSVYNSKGIPILVLELPQVGRFYVSLWRHMQGVYIRYKPSFDAYLCHVYDELALTLEYGLHLSIFLPLLCFIFMRLSWSIIVYTVPSPPPLPFKKKNVFCSFGSIFLFIIINKI